MYVIIVINDLEIKAYYIFSLSSFLKFCFFWKENKLIVLVFILRLTFIFEKRTANFIRRHKIANCYVKIVLWILTPNFTNVSFVDYSSKQNKYKIRFLLKVISLLPRDRLLLRLPQTITELVTLRHFEESVKTSFL